MEACWTVAEEVGEAFGFAEQGLELVGHLNYFVSINPAIFWEEPDAEQGAEQVTFPAVWEDHETGQGFCDPEMLNKL